MVLNCANCGAPIESDKKACPYCKISYGFRTKIEMDHILIQTEGFADMNRNDRSNNFGRL